MNSLLARLFLRPGAPARSLCNGLKRCGRCAVRFTESPPAPVSEDRQVFTAAELAAGWRLACRHEDTGQDLLAMETRPVRDGATACWRATGDLAAGRSLLAVDLGTTSLDWRLLRQGQILAEGRDLNPQGAAGAEVMSRLALARTPEGAAWLREALLAWLGRRCAEAAARGFPVDALSLAGNSVITHLLLGWDVSGLAAAPYRLDRTGGEAVDLPGLPPAWIAPLAGPFLGGDVLAGLAWLTLEERVDFPCLFMDLGTNGECVLLLDETRLLACSVALGPALEGVGLSCGRLAGPGVATAVTLTPRGVQFQDMHGLALEHPEALSGSGALGLADLLLRLGLLGEDGRFRDHAPHPLAERVGQDVCVIAGERGYCLDESGRTRLAASDLEELLKVKAAANAAVSVLLREAGLAARDLAAVRLAGALGRHIPLEVLEGVGLLPRDLGGRVRGVGNASLAGAARMADADVHGAAGLAGEARAWATAAARRMQLYNLAESKAFQTMFLERMVFRHVP